MTRHYQTVSRGEGVTGDLTDSTHDQLSRGEEFQQKVYFLK
jgi:hypothetical protein